ncbi:MAG: hypothetical protein ACTHNE_13440 [Dyella sp.]|uniref:hypothetical protein n=1 Tax=Dyella sp. TaxID=1869338 RepID=UPI003F81C9BB
MRFGMTLRSVLALASLAFAGATFAQTSPSALSNGLGQAWPNVADQSLNANVHVFVFVRNGIKYVQVNDLNGKVLGAVGTVGGTRFALPMGASAQNVVANASAVPTDATTVYQDADITMLAVPTSNGVMLEATCGSSVQCQGGH